MASEPVRIANYLDAADTRSTLAAVARARRDRRGRAATSWSSRLRPARARSSRGPIDVGNAGTLMRLLPGWLAVQQGASFMLDGDASIRRRPVDRDRRAAAPDGRRGSRPATGASRRSRITARALHGIDYELPVASAQVKSCVLLAGLVADGRRRSPSPSPSRDHTERMLAAAGAPSRARRHGRRFTDTVRGADELGSSGRGAGRSVLGGLPDRRRRAGAAAPRLRARARRRELDAYRLRAHPRADGGDRARPTGAAGAFAPA